MILGLIGGGGSVLGVPVLVYLNGYNAVDATALSLFVVGITSLIGAFDYLRRGELSAEAIFQFAIASMISVFCTRKFILPAIPEELHMLGLTFSKHILILMVFSLLLIISSWSMIRKRRPNIKSHTRWDEFSRGPLGIPFIILLGTVVGFITGFVGAGGGFIIVPVLIFVLHLKFKKAIGTSLSIIAINSLVGFSGTIGEQEIPWGFLLTVTAIAVAGILIGSLISEKVPSKKLKPAFGWFTLAVGLFIIVKEFHLI